MAFSFTSLFFFSFLLKMQWAIAICFSKIGPGVSVCGMAPHSIHALQDLDALDVPDWRYEPLHTVLLENPTVRIYQAVIKPGESTLLHKHSENTIYVTVDDGGNASVQNHVLFPGLGLQKPCEMGIKTGSTFCMMHKDQPLIHQIQCPASNERSVHFIGLEMLSQPSPRQRWTLRHLSYDMVSQTDLARIYRLVLRPGEKTGMHVFDFCGVVVFLSDGDLTVSERAPPPSRKRGQPLPSDCGGGSLPGLPEEKRPRGSASSEEGRPRPLGGGVEWQPTVLDDEQSRQVPPMFSPPSSAAADLGREGNQGRAAREGGGKEARRRAEAEAEEEAQWDEWSRLPFDVAEEELVTLRNTLRPPAPQCGRIVDVQARPPSMSPHSAPPKPSNRTATATAPDPVV
jgi:hypothetical protein